MPLRRCVAAGLLVALVAGWLTGCPQQPTDTRPQAAFSADVREGAPPLVVRFSDESVPYKSPIRSWNWNFGDGTQSTDRNPIKTFSVPGQYTVQLSVASADGQTTLVREGYIRVVQNTSFSVIGPAGGTVAQLGAAITVLPDVFEGEVAFGFRQAGVSFVVPGEESVSVVGAPLRITHTSTSNRMYASELGDVIQPARLVLTFDPNSVPQEDRNGDHLFILAQFENTGRTVPIPGTVSGNTISAPVTNLPPRAVYAVGYRPTAQRVSTQLKTADKVPTSFLWTPKGEVYFSDTMLNQLTALRTGNLLSPSSFGKRNFSQLDRNTTLEFISDDIGGVYPTLAESGLRAPRVITQDDKLKLIFFNMSPTYPTNFSDVNDVVFQDSSFGNLVIDPAQLLAISTRNGIVYSSDASQVDLAQVLGFRNAFAEGVMSAVIDGIEYPQFPFNSPLDGAVSALDGVERAAVVFMAQSLDGRGARTLGDNERMLLNQTLFIPFGTEDRGYAVAGQDFFTYLLNRYAPGDDPYAFLTESIPPNLGILEAARFGVTTALEAEPNLTFEAALLAAADAIDTSMDSLLGVSLAEAYKEFAIDVIYERSEDALIRPSKEDLPSFEFDAATLATTATVDELFIAPSDEVNVSSSNSSVLSAVPPLTSRVVLVDVNPLTTDVVLNFNADEWPVDSKGNTVSVTVFQSGEAGVALEEGDDSITLSGFSETQDCLDQILILVSNTNLQAPADVAVTATAIAALDVPENEVLPEYVDACQADYEWEITNVGTVAGSSALLNQITLRTGAWRGEGDVSGGVWEHQLGVIIPPTVSTDTALLFITGGSVDEVPVAELTLLAQLAEDSRSVIAVLATVPNQPLTFVGEEDTRSEDAIIAKSFDEYLTGFENGTPDKTWPALLPMTRAAMRAMDTVQAFLSSGNNSIVIRGFVVGGASKRGWTTWLTAAMDGRVRAIMPLVADVLDLDEQMAHHFRSYGFYSSALQDYVDSNVFDRLSTPQGQSLLGIVDPMTYVAKLSMPKFIANSTGDQFFLPDSSQFYLDELPGNNQIYFAPNTDHGLASGTLARLDEGTVNSFFAWYIGFVRGATRPSLTYQYLDDETVVITTDRAPASLTLWQATNQTARDFRLQTFGPNWKSTPVTGGVNNRYVVSVDTPDQGWTAWMVQATFPGPDPALDLPYGLSSPVRVTPDLYPDEID